MRYQGICWTRHGSKARYAAAAAVLGLCIGYLSAPRRAAADDKPMAAHTPSAENAKPEPPPSVHDIHVNTLSLDCTTCHQAPKGAKGPEALVLSVRPGHAICKDCHDEVAAATEHTTICKACHVGPDFKLEPFPSGEVTVPLFSHVKHVDPLGRVNTHGVREDCVFCHQPSTTGPAASIPTHAQCASCHAGDKAASPKLDLSGPSTACQTCHSLAKIDAHLAHRFETAPMHAKSMPAAASGLEQVALTWKTGKGEPYRDVVPFPHQRHVKRRDGSVIDCTTCHKPILTQTDLTQGTSLPTMKQCAACHENATYVRQPFLIKQCQVCHRVVRADMHPLPSDPVSQQLVHNESFRRLHRLQADQPDALCGSCHREAINVAVDKCAGCHSSMQPRSHLMARFNDIWHGRQAALDRQQCAACHTADFCVKCHSTVLPRTHVPLEAFRAGGHRQAAALNLRACFTCHQFEQTCAECHQNQLRPPIPGLQRGLH